MKASFLLYCLGALASTWAETYCPYLDYICATGDVEPLPNEVDVNDTPELCSAVCTANADCDYWTFEIYRGKTECFLLTDCTIHEVCQNMDNCKSGPTNCDTEPTNCLALDYSNVSQDSKTWSCIGGVNPYAAEIPPDTVCQISCPTWKDGTTPFPGTVKATCGPTTGPDWTLEPLGAVDQGDVALNPASNPTPSCKCADITIPANTLEVGENGAGAELYINNVKQDATSLITIPSGSHVVLLCDRHPVMDFSCMGGEWFDASFGPVTDCTDIYCYQAPASCDGSPDPPTTPTAAPTPPEV